MSTDKPTFSMVDSYHQSTKPPVGLAIDISKVTRTFLPAFLEVCSVMIRTRLAEDAPKLDNRIVAYHAYKEAIIDIFSLYDQSSQNWLTHLQRSAIYLDLAGLGDEMNTVLACDNVQQLMLAIRALECSMLPYILDAVSDHIRDRVSDVECIVADSFNSTTLIIKVFPK